MQQDVYRIPASDLGEEKAYPSSRLAHCVVAWIAGFLLLPLASVGLLELSSSDSQVDLLRVITSRDVIGFVVAGCVSATAVSPFRRLPLWVAALAGFVPLLLLLFVAVAISIHQNFV